MENDYSSASRADSEDDLHLLLECLQFQKNCVSSQCQALTTLATMCSNSSTIRDRFRCSGGMKYVLELLYSTSSPQIQQAALYTLGCAAEMNVVNQLKLCDAKLFTFLADLLKSTSTTFQANDSTTSSTNPAITATTAYLAGCLMCNNSQGQNLARERRVLHKLAGQFKCHLPSLQESSHKQHQDGQGHHSLEVWTSVCSALYSATNNPQNEVNQSLCSQLLPAALSVLNHTSLKTDILRPAVTLIASCVSNNVSTQNRLRLVGGLQILVSTLKQLMLRPVSSTSISYPSELTVHIVRTLSAAMLGNVENTHLVSTLDVIPVLLHLLQHSKRNDDGVEETATIVMCLGMLTEERPLAQQQLVSNGGVQLLLSAMAESRDGELNKAITFVLQQCLQQPDTVEKVDQNLCDEIARVEGLLVEEDQFLSPVRRLNESQQNKLDVSSPTVVSVDPQKQTTSAVETLKILDSQKLPVLDRVSTWLANNEACQNKQEDKETTLEELHQYITRVNKLALTQKNETTENSLQMENIESVQPPQNKQVEGRMLLSEKGCTVKQHDSENVKQAVTDVNKECACTDASTAIPSQVHSKPVPNEAAQKLCHEKAYENLQAELAKERDRRLKLEKELHKLEQIKQQKRQKENCHKKKTKPPKQDVTVRGNQPTEQADGKLTSHTTVTKNIASSLKQNKESLEPLCIQVDTSTPPLKKPNTRYAASANIHQSHSLRTIVMKSQLNQQCKHQSKTPGPNHSLSTLRNKNGNTAKDTDDHDASNQHKEDSTVCNKENHPQPTSVCAHKPSTDGSTSATTVPCHISTHSLVTDKTSTIEFQRPLSQHHIQRSTTVINDSHHYSCDHQCLGCKPRLKCPLITSRNFTTLLKTDCFTCPYHKRLVQRLITGGHSERDLSGSRDCHVTIGEGSKCYRDERTHIPQRNVVMENGMKSSEVPFNTHSVHQSYSPPIEIDVYDLEPNNNGHDELLVKLSPPLNDSLNTLTTNKSLTDSNTCTITTASSLASSPEVAHSHEHDPDWSPAALSESIDSSCEIVSVKHGVCKEHRTLDDIHCKTESLSTVPSLDEECGVLRDLDTQYSQSQRLKVNSGVNKSHETPNTSQVLVDQHATNTTSTCQPNVAVLKKNTITSETHNDYPCETMYQLTAQPRKPKTAPMKLRSLPQRNALKCISNQQKCSSKEQRRSLSVFDYGTPQKVPSKYDQAKIKKTQYPNTERESKPTSCKQQRVLWSKSEEENLIRGVNKMGRRWKHILDAYSFHPCRTPVHLKDKYRNIIGRH